MQMQHLSGGDHENFRNINETISKIQRRARILIAELADIACEDTLLGPDAFVLTLIDAVSEQGLLANFNTPFGRGRVTLRNCSEDNRPIGLIIFSRLEFDQSDLPVWERRFTVIVPAHDSPYVKTQEQKFIINLAKRRDQDFSDSLFELLIDVIANFAKD